MGLTLLTERYVNQIAAKIFLWVARPHAERLNNLNAQLRAWGWEATNQRVFTDTSTRKPLRGMGQ